MRTQYKSLENPKSFESELHSLHNQKFVAPPLDDEFYQRSPEDKDPVIDYWQLAQRFDWSGTF